MRLLHPQKCEYSDVTLLSLYVTLGIFLLFAVRDQLSHPLRRDSARSNRNRQPSIGKHKPPYRDRSQ
jgi:hypothetical protein